jgi:hypothetical protein
MRLIPIQECLRKVCSNIPDSYSFGETWESIKFPEGYEKPPKEEFETKLQQLVEENKWKDLRQERNKRLAEVDWIFSEDYSIDDDSYQQWLTYRKALRDLPSLTEDPENPVWPSRPPIPMGTTENKDHTRELRIENNRLKNKVTILENRQTHFNTLLVNLIGRIETLERPT